MSRPAIDYQSYEKELRALRSQFQEGRKSPALPPKLYHYTSAAGLFGILTESKVRATSLKYMNDYSELTYARTLLHEAFDEQARAHAGDPLIGELLGRCRNEGDPFQLGIYEAFAFCLSEKKDQLSQWRAYTGNGAGYAIGFALDAKYLGVPWWFGEFDDFDRSQRNYSLVRVEYDPATQRNLLFGRVTRVFDLFIRCCAGQGPDEVSNLIDHTRAFLAEEVAEFIYSFKDPAFSEEAEWRAVHINQTPSQMGNIDYRVRGSTIVPFVRMLLSPFSYGPSERMPVAEVVQGPQIQPELVEETLSLLLQRCGHAGVPVTRSKVPLRC